MANEGSLPVDLSRCLQELTKQCEILHRQNKELRSNLEARVGIADCKVRSVYERRANGEDGQGLPGAVVGDDCLEAIDLAAHPDSKPPPPKPVMSGWLEQHTPPLGHEQHLIPSTTPNRHVQSIPTNASKTSWKDCTDLHPSAHDDPGAETLASSRLGMLRDVVTVEEGRRAMNSIMDFLNVFDEGERSCTLHRWVHSIAFKAITTLAIVANTFYIGAEADMRVKNSYRRLEGKPKNPDWLAPNIVFAVWFALEFLLRMLADKRDFFVGADQKWNAFDGALVFNSALELLVPDLQNLSFLRIFRVFRVVRVVRIVRTIKALQSLRTMVFALLNSFVCLLWAFAMIMLIIFVFGIIFDSGVTTYFDDVDIADAEKMTEAKELHANFGTLYDTMVSLFSAITGGNDWMGYADLLKKVPAGEAYFIVFMFYIGFCLVGMLNVVTGIFVDSAVCTRTEDEVVQCWIEDQQNTSDEVRRIFKEADKDQSGAMSLAELVAQLENPWVKAYFSGLDIDPSEAKIIYTLMDTDGDDAVSIDEFVNGTMKLKGQAKSIDVLALMFDQARFAVKFNKLCSYIEDQMRDIKDAVAPGTVPTPRLFKPIEESLEEHDKHFSKMKTCSFSSKNELTIVPCN